MRPSRTSSRRRCLGAPGGRVRTRAARYPAAATGGGRHPRSGSGPCPRPEAGRGSSARGCRAHRCRACPAGCGPDSPGSTGPPSRQCRRPSSISAQGDRVGFRRVVARLPEDAVPDQHGARRLAETVPDQLLREVQRRRDEHEPRGRLAPARPGRGRPGRRSSRPSTSRRGSGPRRTWASSTARASSSHVRDGAVRERAAPSRRAPHSRTGRSPRPGSAAQASRAVAFVAVMSERKPPSQTTGGPGTVAHPNRDAPGGRARADVEEFGRRVGHRPSPISLSARGRSPALTGRLQPPFTGP